MAKDKQSGQEQPVEGRAPNTVGERMPKGDWEDALKSLGGKGAQLYMAKPGHQYAGVARFATETHVVLEFSKEGAGGKEKKIGIIHDLQSLSNGKAVLKDIEDGRLLGKRVTIGYDGSVGQLAQTRTPFVERFRDAAAEIAAEIKSPARRAQMMTFAEGILEKISVDRNKSGPESPAARSTEQPVIEKKNKPVSR